MIAPGVWAALTLALARASTCEQVADVIGTHALLALGASGFAIGAFSRDGAALEVLGVGGEVPPFERAWRTIPLAVSMPITEVARTARPLWLNTIDALREAYPSLAEYAATTGNLAWAFVPLMTNDLSIGALGFSFRRSRRFGSTERMSIEALASQCALVLSHSLQQADATAARLEADSAGRVQRRVLQAVAHELRTPLTSLWGYARMARRTLEKSNGDVDLGRLRRSIDAVDRQAARLARLAAVIGDAAMAEGGQLLVHPRVVDIVPSLARVVHSTSEGIASAQPIEIAAPESLHAYVDLARFEQLLLLLLDNAMHFTPDTGQISVCLRQGEDDLVVLEIRDSGPGIPELDRERAFAPFFQGRPASHAAGHTGLGLGLTVCRAIVEAHRGSIRLEPGVEESVGTRVVVTFPRQSDPSELLT